MTCVRPSAAGRRARRLTTLAATAGALAVAGGAMTAGASPARTPAGHHAAKSVVVVKEVKVAKLGVILTTTKGFTLYRYTPDKAGKVECTGQCTSYWPPLTVAAGVTPAGPNGLKGLGTVMGSGGKEQVTYRGHPLYTYVGDSKPGQTHGQGTQGTWWVVTANVKALVASPAMASGVSASTTTAAPSTTTASGGYGY
jgi:predicted lipoprotein with Yx(FWY)xxD motif